MNWNIILEYMFEQRDAPWHLAIPTQDEENGYLPKLFKRMEKVHTSEIVAYIVNL